MPLRQQLKELATVHPRYGYLMLHNILKSRGLVQNKKKTYRLYTEENLQMRTKKRKKLTRPLLNLLAPLKINERWAMDFVSDQLSNGRRFRILNVMDHFNREMVGQLVGFNISGHQVARFLTELLLSKKTPSEIICDNGSEFTSKAMFFWSKENNVVLNFIQPGKPTQNAFMESLNGKFRNECLNQHWFRSIEEAQREINGWCEHYNHNRPHSSLGYVSPIDYLKKVA